MTVRKLRQVVPLTGEERARGVGILTGLKHRIVEAAVPAREFFEAGGASSSGFAEQLLQVVRFCGLCHIVDRGAERITASIEVFA